MKHNCNLPHKYPLVNSKNTGKHKKRLDKHNPIVYITFKIQIGSTEYAYMLSSIG
uniref:Uncharacterized protein n=1 Tax=viral metagenome TaxID=1070528 RepID=A0A6H1ZAA4_9ZZZZ